MLFKCVFNATAPSGTSGSGLSDVTDADAAVLWAIKNGIIKGFPDGTFRANAILSRQDAFVITARFLDAYSPSYDFVTVQSKKPSYDFVTVQGESFSDMDDVADWAVGDISFLAKCGLIRGAASDSSLLVMPGKKTTTGELITLIARLLNGDY